MTKEAIGRKTNVQSSPGKIQRLTLSNKSNHSSREEDSMAAITNKTEVDGNKAAETMAAVVASFGLETKTNSEVASDKEIVEDSRWASKRANKT